jgi:hypothetical protein
MEMIAFLDGLITWINKEVYIANLTLLKDKIVFAIWTPCYICIILYLYKSLNPAHGNVYSDTHYKVCQWLATGRWFSPGTPLSSTNKTERYDIWNIVEIGVKHYMYTI